MPFNGSGTYVPPASPTFPAVSGETIMASRFNAIIQDIGTALSQCLTRRGEAAMLGPLPMGGMKITGMADAEANSDAASYGQISAAVTDALDAVAAAYLTKLNPTSTGTLTHTGALTLAGDTAQTGNITAMKAGALGEGRVLLGNTGTKFLEFATGAYRMPGADLVLDGVPVMARLLRGLAEFTGATGVLVFAFGTISVVRNSAGYYTITHSLDTVGTSYVVIPTAYSTNPFSLYTVNITAKTATTFDLKILRTLDQALDDPYRVSFTVFGSN